ncbi:MAG: AI-2E family transporter [Hyphomicrobiaceae bacterium]|nr:AI-2E family transporter [Hyphomicrobiaceae bacterium]
MNDTRHPNDLPTSEVMFVRRIVIVAAFVGLGAAIWFLSDVLLLVFASILVAVLLRAIADPLTRKLGIGDGWALVMAGVAVMLILGTGMVLFGSQIGAQLGQLFRLLPAAAEGVLGDLGFASLQDLLTGTVVGDIVSTAYRWGTTIVAAFTGLLFVIFTGIYLSIDPRAYRNGLVLLFPPRIQPQIGDTIDDAGRALGLWLVGQLTAMALVGILTALGLWLIGLQSAFALGFIAGLADFIPIVGPIAAAIPGLLVASGQGLEMVVWTLAVYIVVQQLESNLILPLIVGSAVRIPPAVGLFAVVALGVLFGPLGILFAYPLAVVVDVAVRRLYVRDTLGEAVEISGEEK